MTTLPVWVMRLLDGHPEHLLLAATVRLALIDASKNNAHREEAQQFIADFVGDIHDLHADVASHQPTPIRVASHVI